MNMIIRYVLLAVSVLFSYSIIYSLFSRAESVQLIFLIFDFLYRYNSCAELVQSRFCSADFKNMGITGIKINRIFRIHNRILRAQFEEKLDELLGKSSTLNFNSLSLVRHLLSSFNNF